MKRFLSLFMALSMFVSIMSVQVAVSAEEAGESTETEQPVELTEKVHFNWNFEDYSSSHTKIPKSTTGSYGKFGITAMGGAKADWDGQAFYPTVGDKTFTYTPTTDISTGKVLFSVDMKLNVNSTVTAKATNWHFENPSTNKFYLLRINYPASSYGSSIYSGYGANTNKDKLFAGVPNEIHTLEILMDLDKKTQTFYVDGEWVKSYTISSAIVLDKGYFRINPNIESIDNFKMVENPKNYTFSQYGNVTTEDDCIIVKFSDTVNVTPNDFVIDDGSTTVTGIEKISGRMLRLNLSNKLTAGSHNISLANANLVANVGTTAKNTTASFTVTDTTDYFDIDFEDAGSSVNEAYFNQYNQKGNWNISGTAQLKADDTYCYAGDETKGVAVNGETSVIKYTLNNPVTSGKLKISYDAAFNSESVSDNQELLAVNDADDNSKLLVLGNTVLGCGADMSISGGDAFEYTANTPYRWDTIIDLDSKTVTNYCNGTAFNTQTITASTLDGGVSAVHLNAMPSVTFFDNFKMTHNENKFGFKAYDIWTEANVMYVEFDDTMPEADVTLTVIDPNGAVVTPSAVTKINSRRYKLEFSVLEKGTYKVTIPHNTKNFTGASLENNEAAFYVSERGGWLEKAPELSEYAYSFAVVGDTHYINYNHPDKLHYIYDYLVDNAKENNLKFVFGLGDMTDADANYEWALAKAQIKRLDTVAPYSIVRGDHDGETKFNSFFPASEYKDNVCGSYDGTMLNTYQRLYIGDINYLVFALDMGASDEVLAWAGDVIEEHPDYNVIITTHAYLNSDGTTLDAEDEEAPTALGYSNNGDNMWDKLIKKYSNIVLVISGHIASDGIVLSEAEGENGNKVTQLLVNSEGLDAQYSGVGLVMMLYFSEDGKTVQTRYYSPIRNAYYLSENQKTFELDVIESISSPIVKTDMEINGVSLKLNLNANNYTGKIFAILYDAFGNITDCKQYDTAETVNVEFDTASSGSRVKLMWWNGVETLIPMDIYND